MRPAGVADQLGDSHYSDINAMTRAAFMGVTSEF